MRVIRSPPGESTLTRNEQLARKSRSPAERAHSVPALFWNPLRRVTGILKTGSPWHVLSRFCRLLGFRSVF